MDELASQVGLSRSRFYDLFQLCTGFSPRAYLDMLCVETAISRLSSGQGKIAEVSAELGFSAQSNFTRFFLNQVGVPPSEYRRAASRPGPRTCRSPSPRIASCSDRIGAWLTASSASRRFACTPARSRTRPPARARRRSTRPPRSSSTPPSTRRSLFNLQTFGNVYSRISNPTVAVFEERMAAIENGRSALACATGQAAEVTAILTLCSAGDHIVSASTLYGGTHTLLHVNLKKLGIETTFVSRMSRRISARRYARTPSSSTPRRSAIR